MLETKSGSKQISMGMQYSSHFAPKAIAWVVLVGNCAQCGFLLMLCVHMMICCYLLGIADFKWG
jgi:hypothetical protein